MASDGDGENWGGTSAAGASMSPISAADLLTRSRRVSRANTNTSTPAKRLFPDNIDSIAPGMTPTSKNQKRRKTPLSNALQTPRRSPRKSSAPASMTSMEQPPPPPSSSSSQRRGRKSRRETQSFATPRTPFVAHQSSLVQAPSSSVAVGKRKARDSDDTSVRVNQFGAWGGGREESPMDLLRKLAAASGRLSSPVEERSMMESITQRLQQNRGLSITSSSSLTAADHTQTQAAMPPPPARRSTTNRQSTAANSSLALSEAGLGRRVAPPQNIQGNIFSDLMGQDMSGNATFFTNRKSDAFTLPGELSTFGQGQGENELSSVLDYDDSGVNREEQLERRIANESARVERVLDTSSANVDTRRLEDVSASFMQGDESEAPFDTGYASPREEEEERREGITSDARSFSREGAFDAEYDDSGIADAPNDQSVSEDLALQDAASNQYGIMEEDSESSTEDDEEEEGQIDLSKELQAARMALLRRRRAKKKAKRFSPFTGNLVPALPSDLVKGLFTSFATPNAGIGAMQSSKGKIKVDKSASEAVEDLSHHFFAQFSQALVSQAEQANRSRVTERDVVALMKSQGQISARHSLSFLARRYLPRELSDLITSTTTTAMVDEPASMIRRKPAAKKKSLALATVEEGEDTTRAEDTTME